MSLREQLEDLKSQYSEELTRDEALKLALDAAELHMKFLKIVTDKEQKSELSRKASLLLDKAEQIKSSKDWTPKPGQSFIDIPSSELPPRSQLSSSQAPVISTKTQSLGKFQPLGSQSITSLPAEVRTLSPPVSKRPLPTQEHLLLLKASKLHGFKFPPWLASPSADEFSLKEGHDQFIDEQDLQLSDDQKDFVLGWRRPIDAIPPPFSPVPLPTDSPHHPTMTTYRNIDLVQDAATDCSVVASLCAGVARAERGHARLLSTVIHPYDKDTERPILSASGKYIVRLHFNGCARKVVIDDRLPTSKSSRTLHVIDRNNPCLLWPALLEKAYLKVRGGYDFLGSNSGTDLWVLAGWIPEQIFLQSNSVEPQMLWDRIFKSFHEFGDVMITMGTGKMTDKAESQLGLAGEHDYAVLELRESQGLKEFLIKNPWISGMSWTGYNGRQHEIQPIISFADSDDEDWASAVSATKGSSEEARSQDRQLPPGVFWMTISDVFQYFDSIYLNWNPGLFTHREDIHGSWDLTPNSATSRTPPSSFSRNPQYTVQNDRGGITWILLSRHFKDRQRDSLIPSLDPEEKAYISLYAFDSGGKRVVLSAGAAFQGCFVDSPQTVLQLDLPAKKPYTIVVAEQDLCPALHTFTLSVWARSPITLALAERRYPKNTSVRGAWTTATAGGNADSPTYDTNPQFALTIEASTTLSLLLETLTPERNVHLKLLHGQGRRIHTIRKRDIIKDSGEYRVGCALAEVSTTVPAGTYTIIVSTFMANQLGNFTLQIDSHADMKLKEIARDGAGRIKRTLPTAVFTDDVCALAMSLTPHRLTRINLAARSVDSALREAVKSTPSTLPSAPQPTYRFIQHTSKNTTTASSPKNTALPHQTPMPNQPPSPILLTLEQGTGPDKIRLISSGSGSFAHQANGVRTGDVDIRPEMRKEGELRLVLQRMSGYGGGGGTKGAEQFAVDMWLEGVESSIDIGTWRAVEPDSP